MMAAAAAVLAVAAVVFAVAAGQPDCVGCGRRDRTRAHPDGGPGGLCPTCDDGRTGR